MGNWGRLLVAGGTDYYSLGRKLNGRNIVTEGFPELPSFHILRTVANVKFTRIFTSHSGCHHVALDINNQAYLFGRNDHFQITHPLPSNLTHPAFNNDGSASLTPSAPFPFPITSLPDENVCPELKSQEIVHAAVGRAHTILVTKSGEAWACGSNSYGQCAQPNYAVEDGIEYLTGFAKVGGDLEDKRIVMASAGIGFSIFLTDEGKVYAVGTGERGVLGNGRTGEHIASSKVLYTEQFEPTLIGGALEGKRIVEITSGQQHTVARDDQGYCYSWGFGGFGRLGLGTPDDALLPVIIPAFAGLNPLMRVDRIYAGNTNTLFIDKQGTVWLCGKWKLSGDGSSGQPWMVPKAVPDIMGYKWKLITAGGVTLFAATYDAKKDGDVLVGWGQNAGYGELALGEGAVKSSTKPSRIEYMDGITIVDIAAGQNTTFVIAKPPPTDTELKIWENYQAKAKAKDEEVIEVNVVESTSASTLPVTSASNAGTGSVDLSGFGFMFGGAQPFPQLSGLDIQVSGGDIQVSDGGPTLGLESNALDIPNLLDARVTLPAIPVEPTRVVPAVLTEEEKEQQYIDSISRTKQEVWEGLDRFPAELEGRDVETEQCPICHTVSGKDANAPQDLLECEMCGGVWHGGCLTPKLEGIPEGEWFCANCKWSGDAEEVAKGTKREYEGGESELEGGECVLML